MAAVGRLNNNIIPLCAFLLIIMMSASSSKATSNVLRTGQSLEWSDKLGYPNSEVSVTLRSCNVELYDDNGNVRWESDTGGFIYFRCTLSLNDNGRLVLTGFFGPNVWISDNANSAVGKYVAILHPEAKLVIYGPLIWTVGVPITVEESNISINNNSDINNSEMVSLMTNLKNTPAIHNALFSGNTLINGGKIAENGYTFILDDCEFILKDRRGIKLWQTFTHDYGKNCYARLNNFGVLAILDGYNQSLVWTNEKQLPHQPPFGEYALLIQSDGTANIYGPDVWSRPKPSSRLMIPRDGLIKMLTVQM